MTTQPEGPDVQVDLAPVPEPVAALWKEGRADRIEIQPLAWPDIRELLERVLDGEIEGATMRRLWSASRGNVMYLRELVSGGLGAGALREREGVWSWKGQEHQSEAPEPRSGVQPYRCPDD